MKILIGMCAFLFAIATAGSILAEGLPPDPPEDWIQPGRSILVGMRLYRALSDTELQMRSGSGIPYDRLTKDNTAFWVYSSPVCQLVRITKRKADSLSVTDGFFQFRLEGAWPLVVLPGIGGPDKAACLRSVLHPPARTEFIKNSGVFQISPLPPAPALSQ